jgi:hypothetical protein
MSLNCKIWSVDFDRSRIMILKIKIAQVCKKSKVKMYKPIWSLVFKYNGSEKNSIWFNSHKNIAIKEIWEKKNQTRTQNVTEFGLKMPTSPGLPTSNNWDWAETLKTSFILVELSPLHKNELSSLSVTIVTTHSKRWTTTHSRKGEHYSSRKVSKKSGSKMIKLEE